MRGYGTGTARYAPGHALVKSGSFVLHDGIRARLAGKTGMVGRYASDRGRQFESRL